MFLLDPFISWGKERTSLSISKKLSNSLSSVTDISKLPVDNQYCCSQTLCTHINLSQLHLNTMAGYWHLQIQLAGSTHLRMQKSARAHINKVISGASIKKQYHQSLKQRARIEDALSTKAGNSYISFRISISENCRIG